MARKRPPRKRTRSHCLAGSLIPSLGFGQANHANRVMLAHRAQRARLHPVRRLPRSNACLARHHAGRRSRSTRPLPEPSPVAGSAESSRVTRPSPETREGGAAQEAASKPSRSFWRRHRRAVSGVVVAVVAFGFVYYVVPRLAGLGPTLRLLCRGDVWWLALGVGLEAVSLLGGVVLFRGRFRQIRKSGRLEGRLPDHDGGNRRHEGDCGGGCRWNRAHCVGTGRLWPFGHRGRQRDGLLRDPHVRRLHGGDGDRGVWIVVRAVRGSSPGRSDAGAGGACR